MSLTQVSYEMNKKHYVTVPFDVQPRRIENKFKTFKLLCMI